MVFAAEKPAALAGAASGVIANDAVVIAVRGFSDHRSCSRLKSTSANSPVAAAVQPRRDRLWGGGDHLTGRLGCWSEGEAGG
jgi:hypothetical protein